MSEELVISKSQDKKERYETILPQLEVLIASEMDMIANLANIAAVLKETMKFFWVGFYLVKDTELVLGPYQGPLACSRIGFGKGACGKAWERGESIIIPDVDQFPGHIACSSESKSEIVIPGKSKGKVVLLFDVDSDILDDFNEIDREYLQRVVSLSVAQHF